MPESPGRVPRARSRQRPQDPTRRLRAVRSHRPAWPASRDTFADGQAIHPQVGRWRPVPCHRQISAARHTGAMLGPGPRPPGSWSIAGVCLDHPLEHWTTRPAPRPAAGGGRRSKQASRPRWTPSPVIRCSTGGGGVDGHAGIQAGRQRIAAGGVDQHRQRLVAGADGASATTSPSAMNTPRPPGATRRASSRSRRPTKGARSGVTGIVDRHPGHGRMVSPAGAGRKGCVGSTGVRTTGR